MNISYEKEILNKVILSRTWVKTASFGNYKEKYKCLY